MTKDTEERRQHDRLPRHFRVELSALRFPLNDQARHEVGSLDISAGGLLVECPAAFAVGDKLQVKIFIASLNKFHSGFFKVFESDLGQFVQAIAEVVRAEPCAGGCRLGLRFLDIPEDDWKALERLIEKSIQAVG